MLTAFEVRNFKSIRSLDLQLRPFMVFVGPNGAGKTNIVQALQLFGDILDRGTTDPAREIGWDQLIRRGALPARGGLTFGASLVLRPRDLLPGPGRRRTAAPEGPDYRLSIQLTLSGSVDADEVQITSERLQFDSAGSTFKVSTGTAGVSVEPGEDRILWEHLSDALQWTGRVKAGAVLEDPAAARSYFQDAYSDRSLQDDTQRRFLRLLSQQRFYTPWLRLATAQCRVTRIRLDASALRDEVSTKSGLRNMIGPNGQGLATAVDGLRNAARGDHNRWTAVLTALQRVYPRIEDVTTERLQPGKLTLRFRERGIAEPLGLSSISDGVLHALALLLLLETPMLGPAGVLAIEEPENAIHPWSLREMVRRAQDDPRRQILLTTHSETVVNAVTNPDALFIVENVNGTTVEPARSREAAIDSIMRDSGQGLGDIWVAGGLGGVPGGDQ